MAGIGDNLAGIMGIMQRNKALREDRRQWDEGAEGRAADTRFKIAEADKAENELNEEDARGRIAANIEREVIDRNNQFNPQAFDIIENNGENAYEMTLGTMEYLTEGMRKHGSLDPNQRVVGYSKTGDGQHVLEIEYTDGPNQGMIAPLTQNGTSDDNDPIQTLSREQLENIAQHGVVSLTSQAGGTEALTVGAANDIVDSAYGQQVTRQENLAKINLKLNELTGGKATSRAWMGYLSNLSEEEQQKEIEERASELGVELIQTQPTPTQTAGNGNKYFGKTPDGEWISYASEEEQAAAYDRGEVVQVTNTTPKTGRFASEPTVDTPVAEEAPPSPPPRRSGGPMAIMGRQEQSGLDAREQDRRESAPQELAQAREELSSLDGQRGPLAVSARAEKQSQVDRLEAEVETLGASPTGSSSAAAQPVTNFQATQDKIVEAISQMSPDEVMARAVDGNFDFISQEDVGEIATLLRERNINSAAQIKELPPREQTAAWATIAAYAPDAGTRTAAVENLRNISETGVASVSAKDTMGTNGTSGKYLTVSQADNRIVNARENYTDDDGNLDIPGFMAELETVSRQVEPGSPAANNVATQQLQLVRQALIKDANTPKGVWDKFKALFVDEAITDSSRVDVSGFQQVVNPETGNIEKLIYRGPDGTQKGHDIDLDQVRRVLGTSNVLNKVLERIPVAN